MTEDVEYATGGLIPAPKPGDPLPLADFDRCGFGRGDTLARHQKAIIDHVFGEGTHERWAAERVAERYAAEEAEGIRAGRIRKGDRTTWYARITWSWDAWLTLWPKGERR